ncbi:hypothetical protein D3C85_661330 [compost metagenome]
MATASMALRPTPLLPADIFVRAPTFSPVNTTSSTPMVRKLALPPSALTPSPPTTLPRDTSTPMMKFGSIRAPNWLLGTLPCATSDGALP